MHCEAYTPILVHFTNHKAHGFLVGTLLAYFTYLMIEGKGKIANHTNNGSAYIKCAGKPTQCDSELDSVVCLCQ